MIPPKWRKLLRKYGKGSFGNLNAGAQKLLNRLLYENLSRSERFVLTRQFRATFLPPVPKVLCPQPPT